MKPHQFGLGTLFGIVLVAGIYLAAWRYMGERPKLAAMLVVAAPALLTALAWEWLDLRRRRARAKRESLALPGLCIVADRSRSDDLALLKQPVRVRARVIGRLTDHTIQVHTWPDKGLTDGGIPIEIPLDLVPPELRLPNSEFYVIFDGNEIAQIERFPEKSVH